MVIFDCNGVLVDSEKLATATVSQEFIKAGFQLPPEVIARFFTGRRAADMFAEVEMAAGRRLPANFAQTVTSATLERFRQELRATPYVAQALSWIRGPKCVASSSAQDRIRLSLQTTDLIRFFDPFLFSASEVTKGKPSPDLFLLAAGKMQAAPRECIVVEDSPVGVAAAVAAGMNAVGFVGGSHAADDLAAQLRAEGAKIIINDMRALKSAVIELRGW